MAAGATYTQIATTTLGSAQSSVTFSSISGSYTDLVLVGIGYNGAGDGYAPRIQFNSDTGTNYSITDLGANGSSASSARQSNQSAMLLGYVAGWDTTSTQVGMFIAHIMNYSNTTTNKTVLSRLSQADGTYPGTDGIVGLWRNTNAITSITILGDTGVSQTFASGSTFSLYGIAAA